MELNLDDEVQMLLLCSFLRNNWETLVVPLNN